MSGLSDRREFLAVGTGAAAAALLASCATAPATQGQPGGGNIVRNTDVTRDGGFVLANSLTNEVTLVKIVK